MALRIVGDAIVIAAIDDQVVSDDGVAFAVGGIHRFDLGEPRVRGAVGQHSMAAWMAMASSASERNFQRFVGFLGGGLGIGILQIQIGQKLVRFDELGIELQGLLGFGDGFIVEAVRADQSEAEISLRVFGIAHERFLEEVGGVLIIEALVEQEAPAHAVVGVHGRLLDGRAEFVVGVLILLQAPDRLRRERPVRATA